MRYKFCWGVSMLNLLIAGVIGVAVFGVMFKLVMPKVAPDKAAQRTKRTLKDLQSDSMLSDEDVSILKEQQGEFSEKLYKSIPTLGSLYDMSLKSGLRIGVGFWVIVQVFLFFIAFIISGFFIPSDIGVKLILQIVAGLSLAYIVPRKILQSIIDSRSDKFLNMFPDAIDMIVRSVRSGHPVNASLKMIADNMDPPVSTEFQRVVDEIAYGRSMSEALARMAQRVDESDISFFVVVLSVQQETGGNLAEVLNNLSSIIRKRKQMRLKIRAMTSEGRMTAWMLGVIPIGFSLLIHFMSPGYLNILFEPGIGRWFLCAAICLVLIAMYIVKRMIKVDI